MWKSKRKNGEYPFLNPIIVTADDFIVDGQHRYMACSQMGVEIKFIKLDFTSDKVKSAECIEAIRNIKKIQYRALDDFFQKNHVGYKVQIDSCASDDKIFYFYKYKDKFQTDKEFTEYLRSAYISSSNSYTFKKKLIELFTSERVINKLLMNQVEFKYLDSLPPEFVIYRGMSQAESESGNFGISWTLDKKVAEQFAHEYIHNYNKIDKPGIVFEAKIKKNDVIAFFMERNESEIIYIHK